MFVGRHISCRIINNKHNQIDLLNDSKEVNCEKKNEIDDSHTPVMVYHILSLVGKNNRYTISCFFISMDHLDPQKKIPSIHLKLADILKPLQFLVIEN